MEERNVGSIIKGGCPKQGLTSAWDLTKMVPEEPNLTPNIRPPRATTLKCPKI